MEFLEKSGLVKVTEFLEDSDKALETSFLFDIDVFALENWTQGQLNYNSSPF